MPPAPPLPENCVVLLGTKGGPAIRPGSTNPTATLLRLGGQEMIVDCGLGVTRVLVDQGVALERIGRIFITHLHSDHYLELGPLLHTAWTAGLKHPVDLWGPPGLGAYWTAFLQAMAADIAVRIADEGRPDLGPLLRIHEIRPGAFLREDGLEVSALRVPHPPIDDAFALSFRTPSHHVVLSGDTAPLPRLADFAKGADLLVHEAMLEAALPALVARVGNAGPRLMAHLTRSHTPAAEAARIAAAAGVGHLALHHLIPSDDPAFGPADWQAAVAPHWRGPLSIGHDGLRIDLGPGRGARAPGLT